MKAKTESTATISVEIKCLEEVDTFTYLVNGVGMTGNTKEDIKARISISRGAFKRLNKIRKDRTISLHSKHWISKSDVNSVLYYVCEIWKQLAVSFIKKLQTYVNGCLR